MPAMLRGISTDALSCHDLGDKTKVEGDKNYHVGKVTNIFVTINFAVN